MFVLRQSQDHALVRSPVFELSSVCANPRRGWNLWVSTTTRNPSSIESARGTTSPWRIGHVWFEFLDAFLQQVDSTFSSSALRWPLSEQGDLLLL